MKSILLRRDLGEELVYDIGESQKGSNFDGVKSWERTEEYFIEIEEIWNRLKNWSTIGESKERFKELRKN